MAFCQIKFLKLQSLTDALVLTMEAGTALEFETQVLNLIDTAKADPHINQESVLKALKELYLAGKNHPTTRGIHEKYSKLQYLQYVITHFNDLNSKTMQTVLQDINVNIDLNSFIPILSQELNRKVYDSFKKKLYAVYYDPDANDGSGKINFSSIDSSQSIQELREELWQVILKTIGEEDTNSVFFDMWSETYLSSMQYAKKMKRALEIVQDRMHNYTMIGGKVSSAWTRLLDEEVIKPLVAIYVLNNFDLVLNQLSEGLIQINYNRGFIQDNNRTADGDLLPKYSLLEQTQGERRYNDENYNTDPEKVFGKHVYAFLLQCPNGRGSFLTKEDILQLTTNIKTRIGQLVYAEKPILAINQSGIEGVKLLLELAQGTTSQPLLDALYKHLKRYDDTFREQISSLPDEEQSEYHRKFDFVNSFINEIINSEPVNHISWTGNDETYLQSSEHTSASKSKYRTALSSKLISNLIDNPNNTSIYFANIVTAQDPNSATEVYSVAYQDWFADITGIDIDSETWETLFASPHNAALMQKFVSVFTDAVKLNLLYKIINEDTIKSFVSEFAKTKEFVRLTDLLVQDKGASRIRFYNQNIDPIPSATIPNEVSRFAENATELKEQIATIFGAGDSRPANANILLGKNGNTITSQNGDFTVNYPGRYVYRSDVYLPNGQIKRARSLSAEEAQAVAFNSDFLDNYITHGIFANQLACFSDKVRHALGIFNARGKVLVPTDALHVIEKSIEDLSIQEIKEVSFNQFSWYYQGVEKQLCKDLSELLGKNITNIDEYAAELEKYSLKELRDKRYKHPNLQIYDQVHWDIIKVNGEKKPIINNSLYYNIRMAHNKDLYFADIQESYNNFKKIDIQVADKFFDLSFILDNIESFRKMLSDGDITKIPTNQEILNLFNRTLWGTESIATWNKGITGDGEAVAKCNELLEVLMLKYFYLTNLMTDADLQIVGKFSFIHPNKDFADSRHFYKDLVKGITSHGFINSELWKDLKKDASARYQNSTKRNSSIVAAAMPMVHSNPYGVAETMRIAHILNLQTALQNFIGEIKDDIDVNDGMVLSTGVQDFLEHNSYLGKNYRGTKKVLGVIPNYMGFTQIKCADFVITNAMVRDSFKSNTRDSRKGKSLNKYDMRILLMKALSASFDNTFYGSFDTLTFGDNMSDFQTKIFREINGEYLLLLEIEWHEGTQNFTFNWGGTLIEEHIESAWDLYRAFGGAYCYEQDENGEFIFSEQSQELVARFICRFNSDYKSRMIAKFADISAVKPGICNDNSTEVVLDKNVELLTQVVKTSRWGIQQDASHESDEATVPNPTQVQTAVQFNGLSIEDAEELNKTLAKVVERKLNKLKLVWGKENGNHFEYYTYLANMLYKSLSKQNYSISDAPEVVAEVLQRVMQYRKNGYQGEMPVVPFSDSSIFYKLASDILSEVNHEMIRQKMAGIPIIQNPSHGIIGIYEDRNGDTYMRSDLLELAKKSITLTEADITKYHTDQHNLDFEEDWLIAKFLDESKLFGREVIDVKSLQIGDSVILINALGQEEHRYISSPIELWELETDGRIIYKDYTAQRDLRPTCITFRLADSGKLENLWFLNSTKALIRAGKNKSLLLKQWHKANLEGLGTEGEGYYFDKLEDFLDYKRGEVDRSVKVTNVNYIAGELIISKLNRTAHDLGHKSLAWIRQNHEDHFYNVAKNRYSRVNRNDLLFTEELTAVYTDKEISIVVDEDKELYPKTNIVHEPTEEQNSRYGVYLTNGELLVYSDTSDIGVSETNQNGKNIITIHVQSVEDALNIANEIKNNESPNTWNSISQNKAINGFVLNNYTKLHGSETDEEIRTILNTVSNELYASFLTSNRTISLRIPSQSFQSFMYNRTVGFLDGEKNDGYVNVWEIWFQGSDYDIDKAYTLMFEVDKSGLIAKVSPLIDYSTEQGIIDNFKLPLPDSKKLISVSDKYTVNEERISKLVGKEYRSLEAFDAEYSKWTQEQKQKFLIKLQKELGENETCHLKYVRDAQGNYVKSEILFDFVKDSNKHNSYVPSVSGLKNRMVYHIMSAASSVKNLWASEQPMSADPVNDVIAELEGNSEKLVYDPINPFTKFLFQEFNSVGKDCVGIAANGVKVDGSLQQYFNSLYSGRLQTEYGDIKIDLNFLLPNGNRYLKTFTRFANTRIDLYEKFNELFSAFTPEDFRQFTEYKKIVQALSAINLEEVNADNYLQKAKIIDSIINDSKLAEEILLWGLENPQEFLGFKESVKVASTNDAEYFKRFLYFRILFEDNAADTLSIFISLATDNAKELKLYKINGTRELLSMGLAMVALGVDLKTALSVTKFLLDPVAKYLNRSAFADPSKSSFADVRTAILTVYSEDGADTITLQSLLKIQTLAAEMNSLSSFYKLNQGVTARYEELLDFLQSLSKLKLQSEKNSDKVIESELYRQPIDIERFVNDSEYQQQLCDYMEQFKVGINVCDVVLKSPAYRAYIEALMWNTGSLKKSCFLANVMDSKVLQGYNSKDNIHRSDLLRAARHYIIGKTLDKMNWILFNKSDLERTYRTSLRGNVSDIINLRSDSLINEFVKFVENHVIPDWKNDEVIGSNYFIRELTKVDNRYKNRSEYIIPYNVMDGDPDTANLINNIQRSFSQIELLSSKLKLAGTNRYLTIGEVVYLYNLLVHENHLGTLSKIANTIKSDLPSYHRQTAIELDSRVRAGEDFSKLFEYFGKLAYASKKGGQSRIFKIGDYEASVNITGSYIWTKAGYTISNILSLNDFVNALEIYDEIQFEETPYKFTSEGVTFYVKNGAPIFIPNTGQFSVNNKIQSISGIFANEVRRLILENNPSIYLILHLGSKKVIVYEEDTLSDNIKHINDISPILSKNIINSKVLKALVDLNKSLGIAYVDDDEKGNNVQRIYVAKYPGRNYLVLNSSLAKNISLQDSYEFLQLIDVLIQSNLEDEGKAVTIQNKAAKLIEILTDKSNSQKYLSKPNEVEDSLPVKSKELFLSYVNKYLNDVGNSYIADACRIERNGLAQALSMPEIFYKDCVEKYLVKNSVTKLIQQGLIKVGDMIAPKLEKDGGKISFLYIGEVVGKYYFVSNVPENMRSLYPKYVVSDRIKYPEVTKFKTLKRSKNDPIGEFTFTDFNYKEKSEKIKADRLYKGFKILRNGELFIVLEAILKGNSVDIIMKSETGNPFLETVDKSTVLTGYGIEGTTTRSEIILGGKNVVINTANNPKLLANFIGQILKGSTFKSKGTEYNLLSVRYENDKPSALIGKNNLTGGTEEISVNEIQSVTIPDYKYSRNMLANIVPILFIQLVNAESLRELKIKVLNAEMLTNSYKAHLLYNKLLKIGWVGEFTQKEKGYEIPYKHTVVLNNTNKLMYSFDGMYKVNNPADLYIGDFILQRTNGSDIISEIIDINGDNITLVQHILPYDVQNTGMRGEKSRRVIFMTPSTSIKAVKLSDLESVEMYSYKRKSNILKYVPTQVTSKIEKSKRFIEYLADKFNAKVIYDENVSANDNWTAKLTEEGIIINTAKAGDDILRHGVHEFTHLVFADMRMRNPEAYFSMILAINDMISRNNHKISEIAQEVKASGEYYSENDIAEEIIVRYLENYSTSLDSSELTEDLVDSEGKLFKLLNTGLSDLFEHMSVNSDEVKMTVGELIKGSLFNSDIQVFNILTLAEDAKLRNLYKLIEYTCK